MVSFSFVSGGSLFYYSSTSPLFYFHDGNWTEEFNGNLLRFRQLLLSNVVGSFGSWEVSLSRYSKAISKLLSLARDNLLSGERSC